VGYYSREKQIEGEGGLEKSTFFKEEGITGSRREQAIFSSVTEVDKRGDFRAATLKEKRKVTLKGKKKKKRRDNRENLECRRGEGEKTSPEQLGDEKGGEGEELIKKEKAGEKKSGRGESAHRASKTTQPTY